jgi:aminomethyltransferase
LLSSPPRRSAAGGTPTSRRFAARIVAELGLGAVSVAPELLHGPLEGRHRELGASFAEFSGWLMPVSYAGTVSEHNATRNAVGLFDVSHLGKALVRGPGAAQFVNSALTNDLGRIGPGKAQYTLCCNESGGVIDDLIAYYVADDEIFLVPNAANTAAVVDALQAAAPAGLTITNQHRSYAVLAVQGARSADVVGELGLPTGMDYMGYADASYTGVPVRVCRTGYTGEHGYELLPPWDSAGVVFDALVAAVSEAGGEPAGLGARDTLRTEMGYPLHGHELSLDISPLQARCGWAIGWKKDAFFGRDALLAEKDAGPRRLLRGLRMVGRGVLRPGLTVRAGDTTVGVTTSGTFSPTLQVGIALALIDTDAGVEDGQQITVDVRGRASECEVVRPPFVEVKTR